MNILPNIKTGISVCPHDCPSACALEVEVLDERTIGRVRGAKDNSYTLGVICEKVARYAERIHHPDRLLHPLKRTGPKGSRQFARISWDEAFDDLAEKLTDIANRHGPQANSWISMTGNYGIMAQMLSSRASRARTVAKLRRKSSTRCG